jgi:hypothetical protein
MVAAQRLRRAAITRLRQKELGMATIAEILAESGYGGLARRASGYFYRRALRRLLPKKEAVRYAGVAIARDRKWGDLTVPEYLAPFGMRDIADYEETLIRGLRSHVRRGDKVVIVGGGEGVTATIAAQLAGESGTVICFEGGREGAESVLVTARRNAVHERVIVHHAIVGKSINIHGVEESRSHRIVDPESLPECDVLELDCEGAEITILERMNIVPRAIIVETHGLFGAPAAKVRQLLEARGYRVADLGWAEPRVTESCIEHDVRILAGALMSSKEGQVLRGD